MCLNVCAVTHALTCRYPPFCVKRIARGPLITHQVSAQSVLPLPRSEKGCTRAPVPHLNLDKTPSQWVSNHESNFSAIRQALPEITKRGHICTCARTHLQMYPPPMTCVICIVAWSLNTQKFLSFSINPFLSYYGRSAKLGAKFFLK